MERTLAESAGRGESAGLDALVVATEGVELALLAARFGLEEAHLCQTWCPVRCFCGRIHDPDEPARLGVVVGLRDCGVDLAGAEARFAVVPSTYQARTLGMPAVVAPRGAAFSTWAGAVTRTLVMGTVGEPEGPLLERPVARWLLDSRLLSAEVVTGPSGVLALMRVLMRRASLPRRARGYQLGLSLDGHLRIHQLREALDELQEMVDEDAELWFASAHTQSDGQNELCILYPRDEAQAPIN